MSECLLYAASHVPDGGVVLYAVASSGRARLVSRYSADRPAYMIRDGERLHLLLREPFEGQSGVVSYGIGPGGLLQQLCGPRPTHGRVGAHIAVVNGKVACANYLSGSTALLPGPVLRYKGSSVHPTRQASSHPHFVLPHPSRGQLLVADLGTDEIHVADARLRPLYDIPMPRGSGPRHLVFSRDGKRIFCVGELDSSITQLVERGGRWAAAGTISTLPEGWQGENTAAALKLAPEGNKLYVSNRGADVIGVVDISGGGMEWCGCLACGGRSPRDIVLTESLLICANELSDTVTIQERLTGQVLDVLKVKTPWCVLAVPADADAGK